jgi:hypothetical protein
LYHLGFRLVFCTRAPDSFEVARNERLKVSGNPPQYNDLQGFVEEQLVGRQEEKEEERFGGEDSLLGGHLKG